MNETSDIGNAGTYRDERGLDPQAAAKLLDQTRREAQRELDFRSPWLSVIAAVVVLVGFGAVWLSVRGQHPFTGPTTASLWVLYPLIAIRIATVLYAHRRASAGVSGRSIKLRQAEIAAIAVVLVAAYLLMFALADNGAGHAAFYWMYSLTATLIVLGGCWATRSAVREDWQTFGICIAVVLVAAGSALAGPRGMWLGNGVGLCIVLLGAAAARAWLPRSQRSDT